MWNNQNHRVELDLPTSVGMGEFSASSISEMLLTVGCMMQALHNQITHLERISFGPLTLPEDLSRGEWRLLTPEEEAALLAAAE